MPRWLRILERILLRGDDREFVAGDLHEEYQRARALHGRRAAALRYLRELVSTPRSGDSVSGRLAADLRYAARSLQRRPVFTAAATLTLAIGIGSTTAIYSIANAALLAPLPYPDGDRLLFVSSSFPGATGGGDQLSYLDIREIENRTTTLGSIAAYHAARALQLTGAGEPERVRTNIVDAAYLRVLGARPVTGRLLDAEDDRAARPVAVLSYAFWTRRLDGDPSIVGRTLTLSDVPLTVVGVLDAAFRDITSEDGLTQETDVFLPVGLMPSFGAPAMLKDRNARNFWALARVRDGATLGQARAEVAAIGEVLQRDLPQTNRGFSFWAERLDVWFERDIRGPVVLLLAGSAFVLLIACANVGNLLVARVASRTHELGIRRAIGARRREIFSLLLAESVLLAAAGGALGVGIAWSSAGLFRAVVPGELTPRLAAVGLDWTTILVGVFTTATVAAILSVMSSLRAAAGGDAAGLRAGTRGSTDAKGARVRRVLLGVEVAAAVMLVIGAYLMVSSLARLKAADVGFDPGRLVTLEMDLRTGRYADPSRVVQFASQLVDALREIPGVHSAMLWGPGRPGRNTWVTFPGREDTPLSAERLMTWRHTVTPGALRALGIPLLAGREFTTADDTRSPSVVIVSETLANSLWPGESAIGKRLRWRTDIEGAPLLTVVGVAADAAHRGRVNSLIYPARDLYVPHAQRAERGIVAVVRTAGEPAAVVGAIRGAVRRLDPDLPLFNITTMAEHQLIEEAETRFASILMTTYAGIALLLAAIGIYGVVSYHVALRGREIAIRLALGATARHVRRSVVLDGVRPAAFGIAAGIGGALVLTRFLSSLLFGVRPRDPWTFGGVALALLVVALLSSWVPARRAARIAPLEALRAE